METYARRTTLSNARQAWHRRRVWSVHGGVRSERQVDAQRARQGWAAQTRRRRLGRQRMAPKGRARQVRRGVVGGQVTRRHAEHGRRQSATETAGEALLDVRHGRRYGDGGQGWGDADRSTWAGYTRQV